MKELSNNNYCVKRHMFFAGTVPIVKDNLTKEQAEIECAKLNREEVDDIYVSYKVHKKWKN